MPSQNRGNVTLSLLRLLEWTDRLKRIRCPRGILELPSPALFLGGRQGRRLAQGSGETARLPAHHQRADRGAGRRGGGKTLSTRWTRLGPDRNWPARDDLCGGDFFHRTRLVELSEAAAHFTPVTDASGRCRRAPQIGHLPNHRADFSSPATGANFLLGNEGL